MTKVKSNKKNALGAVENGGGGKKSKVSHGSIVPVVTTTEKWDVLRKMTTADEVPCRMKACPHPAIECWASNLNPEDQWNMCGACVESEFGPEVPSDDAHLVAQPPISNSNDDDKLVTTTIIDTTSALPSMMIDESESSETCGGAAKHVSDHSSIDDDDKQSSDDDSTNHEPSTSIETPATTAAIETPSAVETLLPETPVVEASQANPTVEPPVATPAVNQASTQAFAQAVENSLQSPAVEPSTVETAIGAISEDTPADLLVSLESSPSTLEEDLVAEKWDVVRKIDAKKNIACRMDDCECSATECWGSNIDPQDVWEMCTACVEAEFGPEEAIDQDSNDDAQIITSSSSKTDENASKTDTTAPSLSTTAVTPTSKGTPIDTDTAAMVDVEEEEEAWDVKKVMSHADLSRDGTIKCGTDTCILAAAAVYMSTVTKEKWYTCLDCQVADYGGWPETLKELPIQSMTQEHKKIMSQKCSRLSSPVFPEFPEAPATSSTNTLTPPPKGAKQVTPTPGPKKSQPSAQAMAIHRKWQAAAESMGGSEARIVVDKKAAKQLIIDLLYDAFCPMNITQIHAALKAVVPSPVLKQCLDDMALDKDDDENMFAESDDDEPKAKKKKTKGNGGDEFSGALVFKAGRNANTSLYFLDHTKQKNDGNGLEFDARNQLFTDKALAEQEYAKLKSDLNKMQVDTKCLLGEPTNEVANVNLEAAEAAMTILRENVGDARKLVVNEKHKKQTKRRIEGMTVQWRKRRRLSMDFLISMEENTDGTISMKKCLSGDGQIDIESDEKAIKDSKTYAENKRSRKKLKPSAKKKLSIGKKTDDSSSSSQLAPDENFIGVELNTQGLITRVFLDNGDNE